MAQEENVRSGKCKFCDAPLKYRFIDMYLPLIQNENELGDEQALSCLSHTYVCSQCFLVQMETPASPAIPEHLYCSSFSSMWLTDLKKYTEQVFERLEVSSHGLVVELAGHDRHLQVGRENEPLYFGSRRVHELMNMYGLADWLICKNELAYVHDINDFVSAMKLFLKPMGTITLEFFHLLPIIEEDQFDLPSFDRFNYFSFTTIDKIFKHHGLAIYDVEKCSAEGLLRIYAKHVEDASKRISAHVPLLRGNERDAGMSSMTYYDDFKMKANAQGRHFNCSIGELQPLI